MSGAEAGLQVHHIKLVANLKLLGTWNLKIYLESGIIFSTLAYDFQKFYMYVDFRDGLNDNLFQVKCNNI